jgi:hypothetical protein
MRAIYGAVKGAGNQDTKKYRFELLFDLGPDAVYNSPSER